MPNDLALSGRRYCVRSRATRSCRPARTAC